jgi:hypothetical protein
MLPGKINTPEISKVVEGRRLDILFQPSSLKLWGALSRPRITDREHSKPVR